MHATDFEFRHRFWIIAGIFWLAFSCYRIDPVNSGIALAQWLLGGGSCAVQGVFLLGTLPVIGAALLRTWGNAYLTSTVVRDRALHTEALVADGPYRHVRNPLYLGNLLLCAGLGLSASRLGYVVLLLGMLLFCCYRLILREEAGLLAAQGQGYQGYCAAVPRLWPALRPRLPSGGRQARWGQAFLGEAWMWGFVLGSALFSLTLNMRVFSIVMGASVVVYVVMKAVTQRQPA